MRKLLLTTAAISALMVASPLVAQNMPNPNPASPANPQTDQAPPDQLAPANPSATPVNPSSAQNDATKPADQKPQFAQEQKDTEILASNLIGADVQDSQQQSLGTVNDIVLAKEGTIDAVVVGVGGFLGIGQKSVAIDYSAFQSTTKDDGSIQLSLNVTKDELNSAPDFKTLKQIRDEQQQAAPQTQSMAPAPASPLTPPAATD